MTTEELKIYLLNKFDSCYIAKHPDYPGINFYYYDDSYIRKLKICKINNKEGKLPNNVNGYCLFQKDMNNKRLYVDYSIWKFFEKNYLYKYKYNDITEFIEYVIKEKNYISVHYGVHIGTLDDIKYLDELIIIKKK